MKKTLEHGLPKKAGWYWLYIPDYTDEIILCRIEVFRKKFLFVYEWHDYHKDFLISYDIKEWKSILKPKRKIN